MTAFAIRDRRLVDPDGAPFPSLGRNHADETALKFPRNVGGGWGEALDRFGDPIDGVLSVEDEDPAGGGTEDKIHTGLQVAHRTLRPLNVA